MYIPLKLPLKETQFFLLERFMFSKYMNTLDRLGQINSDKQQAQRRPQAQYNTIRYIT